MRGSTRQFRIDGMAGFGPQSSTWQRVLGPREFMQRAKPDSRLMRENRRIRVTMILNGEMV